MAFCKNCGNLLEENAKFCTSCGAAQTQSEPTQQDIVNPDMNMNEQNTAFQQTTKASGALNMAQLIWAIVNLICCCMPFGVAALVLTILAKDAPNAEEEAKKLKIAKICNLIATIGGAVISVISFVIGFLGAL